MDYLFDNKILYRTNEGKLHYLDVGSTESITLPPVLNRVLLLLVINQGQVITKDDFLIKVWENYGKPGSANTLNQYLSTLRGIFAHHLGKKAIITVPKQGYMLSFEIDITFADEEPAEITAGNVSKNISPESVNIVSPSPVSLISKKLCFFYFFLLIVVIAITLLSVKRETPTRIHPYEVGKLDECPVYSFSKYETDLQKKSAMEAIIQQAKQYGLNCERNIMFYYYRNKNIGYREKGDYSMLTRCKEGNNAHDECLTIRVSW